MNVDGRPHFWLAAATMALISAAGGFHGVLHAQELKNPPKGYNPSLPHSDARVGIQKHSPYLYRYENDWQRNRVWRDRHDPLRNLPTIRNGQESKTQPEQGHGEKADDSDP